MKKINKETIVELVKQYSNNFELGAQVRDLVHTYDTIEKEAENARLNFPNKQLSMFDEEVK